MEKTLEKLQIYINDNYEPIVKETPSLNVCTNRISFDFEKQLTVSFSKTLLRIIDDKKLIDTDVYKKANIDRRHFSKMRNDNYHPRKNTIIKLIYALKLNIEEAQMLLSSAGYMLSTSILRDVIIMYTLKNKIYDIMVVNDLLAFYHQEYI